MIHQLPLLTEKQYIATIHSRLQDSQPWKLPGLQAIVRLAWALALRGISQLPDVTGKLIVDNFTVRNKISTFNGSLEGRSSLYMYKHEHRKISRVALNETSYCCEIQTFFFLSPKRNYVKYFFPFLEPVTILF